MRSRKVHTSFLDVGCDVIETNSFGGSEVVLTEFGIADKTYDVNKKAAELAKRIASDYSTPDKPRFVAGSIGPGTKLPTLGHITYPALKDAYREQVHGLVDGGSDVLIVETCQDLLQTKAALAAIFEFFEKNKVRIPVIAQVTIEVFGTMLNGTEIGAALTALEPFPIDVIGMNCGTGPRHMTDSFQAFVRELAAAGQHSAERRFARGPRRGTVLRRIAGELCGAGRAFCKGFWREHRRRLLRYDAGIY